jgi:hypothetical protein
MSTIQTSINSLPVINELQDDDKLIVQTENATSTIAFKDFIVGTENTTFGNTIATNSTNISTISSTLFTATTSVPDGSAPTHYIPITINGVSFGILLSAVS